MSKPAPKMRMPGAQPAAPSAALDEWSKAPAQKALESLEPPAAPPEPETPAPAPAAPAGRKTPWSSMSPTETSPLNVAIPRVLHAKLKLAAQLQDEKLRDLVIRVLEREVDASLKELGYD